MGAAVSLIAGVPRRVCRVGDEIVDAPPFAESASQDDRRFAWQTHRFET